MPATAPNTNEIRAAIIARLQHLRPLIDEYRRLEQAEQILAGINPNGSPGELDELLADNTAPYGYKADGTPRKRPAPKPETQAKAAKARQAKRIKLKVA